MKFLALPCVLLGFGVMAGAAFAEGGYYSGPLGGRAAGRAGAVTARADDLSAILYNPAGLANLDATLVEIGNQASYNAYSYTRAPTLDYGNVDPTTGVAPLATFNKVSNGRPWQGVVPMLSVASKLGRKDWGFALAAYAPPGIGNMSFPMGGGQRYLMLDREAIFLKYVASAAWKYGDVFGVGASAEWIHVPLLKYSLVIDASPFAQTANPVSSNLDMVATMKGSSLFTFNAVLGAWYKPVPSLVFGISGQVVPANIVTKGNLSVVPLDSAWGDVTLTRDGSRATDVTVTLPLPLLARAGVRYRHLVNNSERFDVELDVEYVTWSRVKQFTIDGVVGGKGLQANYAGDVVNINRIDIEKRWRDTIAVRLGGDYAAIPGRLALRAGGYYESGVADPAYANVDFTGAAQFGGALGVSVFFRRLELVAAYMAKLQPGVTVSESGARVYQQVPGSACQSPYTSTASCHPNFLGQPSPAVNAGTYSSSSHMLYLSVLYRYGL
jgi:long-subunit fatty acid transport protein